MTLALFLFVGIVGCEEEEKEKEKETSLCSCEARNATGRIVDDPYGIVDYSKEYGYSILHGSLDAKGNHRNRFIPCPTPSPKEQLPNGTEIVLFGDTYSCPDENITPRIIRLLNYELQSKKEYETPYFESVGNIIEVFELAYGKTKEFTLNGKKVKIKLIDIEDTVLDCSLYDMSSQAADMVRVVAFIEVSGKEKLVRIPSRSCAPIEYDSDKDNIKDIRQKINSIREHYKNFDVGFRDYFARGRILEYPYKLFIGKTYPLRIYYKERAPFLQTPPTKKDYKFIFILTKIKWL